MLWMCVLAVFTGTDSSGRDLMPRQVRRQIPQHL